MTTDDLRTRAREAAEKEYPLPDRPSQEGLYRREDITSVQRYAFIAGFLAHAAQQPTREDIARAIAARHWDRDSGDVEVWDTLTSDDQESVIENYAARDSAAAVLALLDGAGS